MTMTYTTSFCGWDLFPVLPPPRAGCAPGRGNTLRCPAAAYRLSLKLQGLKVGFPLLDSELLLVIGMRHKLWMRKIHRAFWVLKLNPGL